MTDSAAPATLGDACRSLAARLRAAGIEPAPHEARLLVQAALGLSAERLLAQSQLVLDDGALAAIERLASRRLNREPVTRIVGSREFYGRLFEIGPEVLDPRPDTETLIDLALELVREDGPTGRPLRILDIGTGSGAILVTLLAELPQAIGLATDISPAALEIARRNAAAIGVGSRATFRLADMLDGLDGQFDLIVSNPPYIRSAEIATLAPEVRCHDPVLALDGGADGLTCYRRIADGVVALVAPGGWVAVEVGYDQSAAVEDLFAARFRPAGQVDIRAARDLAGVHRCVALRAQLA